MVSSRWFRVFTNVTPAYRVISGFKDENVGPVEFACSSVGSPGSSVSSHGLIGDS